MTPQSLAMKVQATDGAKKLPEKVFSIFKLDEIYLFSPLLVEFLGTFFKENSFIVIILFIIIKLLT